MVNIILYRVHSASVDIIQTIYTSNLHERHFQRILVKMLLMKSSVKCVQVNTTAARERKTDVSI